VIDVSEPLFLPQIPILPLKNPIATPFVEPPDLANIEAEGLNESALKVHLKPISVPVVS